MTTIWIDVEDLFDYAKVNPRPSGIQRVAYEICRSLAASQGSSVGFLRHTEDGRGFITVAWDEVEALFARLTRPRAIDLIKSDGDEPNATGSSALENAASDEKGLDADGQAGQPSRGVSLVSLKRRTLRWMSRQTPEALRPALGSAVLHQISVFRYTAHAARLALAILRRRAAPHDGPSSTQALEDMTAAAASSALGSPHAEGAARRPVPSSHWSPAKGDVVLVLGSPWFHSEYGQLMRRMKEEKGVRLGVLIYDIIPLRRPEWCDAGLVRIFGHWLSNVLPEADLLFAISEATADDVEAYGRTHGWNLPMRPIPIPMGTGFGRPAPALRLPGRSYPKADSYALIVSTIEARKNHQLLFRVWRRMLEEMPPEKVPTLVFAGRVGWMVSDLMQQIRNARGLDGKLVVFEDPTDGELTTLYQGARFTLFPSFYEGWGLPVTESLSFGKPCIISSSSSLPEAGGALARYFDPENTSEAYRVIRGVVEDPEGLRNWQARVAREFRPVSWDEAAGALVDGIGRYEAEGHHRG